MSTSSGSAAPATASSPPSHQLVGGREVARRTVQEVIASVEADVDWKQMYGDGNVSVVSFIAVPDELSVMYRCAFIVPCPLDDLFDALFVGPELILFHPFIRSIQSVERFDWLNSIVSLAYDNVLFAGMMTLFHTIHFDDATRTYVSAWRSVTQLERSQIEWKPYLSHLASSGFVLRPLPQDPEHASIVNIVTTYEGDAGYLTSLKRLVGSKWHGMAVSVWQKAMTLAPVPLDIGREVDRIQTHLYSGLLSLQLDWQEALSVQGASVFTRRDMYSDGSAELYIALRGSYICNVSPAEIAVFIRDNHATWDLFQENCSVIQHIDPETIYIYKETSARMGLTNRRGTVLLWAHRQMPSGAHMLLLRSVLHPAVSVLPVGVLPIWVLPSGAMIFPLDNGRSLVNWIVTVRVHQTPQEAVVNSRYTFLTLATICSGIASVIGQQSRTSSGQPSFKVQDDATSYHIGTVTPSTVIGLSAPLENLSLVVPSMKESPASSPRSSPISPLESQADRSGVSWPPPTPQVQPIPRLTPPKRQYYELSVNQKAIESAVPAPGFCPEEAHGVETTRPFAFAVGPLILQKRLKTGTPEPPQLATVMDAIPNSILRRIFAMLTIEDLYRVSLVSKRFSVIVREQSLWEAVAHLQYAELEPARASGHVDYKLLVKRSVLTTRAWKKAACVSLSTAGHSSSVKQITIVGDNLFISGSSDRKVKLWNHETSPDMRHQQCTCSGTFAGPPSPVAGVDVKNGMIFAGFRNGAVRAWSLGRGDLTWQKQLVLEAEGFLFLHPRAVVWKDSVRVWDIESTQLIATLTGHVKRVTCARPLAHTLLTSSIDKTVRLWDMMSSTCVQTLKAHNASVNSIEIFSQVMLATCSNDRTVKVWDMRLLDKPVATLAAHTGAVRCIRHNSKRLVSGGDDHVVFVWDCSSFTLLQRIDRHPAAITCIDLTEGLMCTGGSDGSVFLHNFQFSFQDDRPSH